MKTEDEISKKTSAEIHCIQVSIGLKFDFKDNANENSENAEENHRSRRIHWMYLRKKKISVWIYRMACARLLRMGSIPKILRISFTLAFFSRIKADKRIKYLEIKEHSKTHFLLRIQHTG